MQAIVLIEKHPTDSVLQRNCTKHKPKECLNAVFDSYKGFEGQIISYVTIDESITPQSIQPLAELQLMGNCSLLYLTSEKNITIDWIKNLTVLVGYEVGGLDQESAYSSIINEVLFGSVDSLTIFKEVLNENLLFPSRSLAGDYVKVHNQMSALGEDVEDFFDMVIYQVRVF